MEQRLLLSICINTYNRQKEFKQCLESIVRQDGDLIKHGKKIEIVVMDDNEKENVKKIIKEYKTKNISISYIKSKNRLGMVRGIVKACEVAKGEYIWILSDDDMICSGGIVKVLQVIKNHKPDSILCNINHFKEDGNKIKVVKRNCLNLQKDILTKTNKQLFHFLETKFLYAVDWYTYAMSPTIISKKLFIKNKYTIEKYNGYSIFSYPQSALRYYSHDDIFLYIISDPLILFRVNNFLWQSTNELKTVIDYNKCANNFWDNVFKIQPQNISFKLKLLVGIRKIIRIIGIIFIYLKEILRRFFLSD